MPKKEPQQNGVVISKGSIQMMISVLGFMLTIGTLLWKGGALTQQISSLQKQVDYQQQQLDQINQYFRK